MTNFTLGQPRPSLRGHSEAATQHQARLSTLRQENKARIADWLRMIDEYSTVAEIAAGTGLSKPTVKERLTDLEATGIVKEVEKLDPQEQGSGRPASRYSFDANAMHVIGVELSAQQHRITFANLSGQIVLRDERDVEATLDPDERLKALHSRVLELEADASHPIGRRASIGVSVPGPQAADGRVEYSSLFAGLQEADVRVKLADLFGVPVSLEHELGAACVAEDAMGSAQEGKDFGLAMVWQEVAASFFIRGAVYHGSRGHAGEVSRLVSPQQENSAHRWSSVSDLSAMVAAAEAGDRAAIDAANEFAARAGEQLASLIVTMDPEVLYLHGPVTEMPFLIDLVREQVPARISPAAQVPIEVSSLGADAPLLGVTLLALAAATTTYVGASATPPRQLSERAQTQPSQSSRERTG